MIKKRRDYESMEMTSVRINNSLKYAMFELVVNITG